VLAAEQERSASGPSPAKTSVAPHVGRDGPRVECDVDIIFAALNEASRSAANAWLGWNGYVSRGV